MKKLLKIVLIIAILALILPNLWSVIVISIFSMPSEMKKESVCFLAPGLTWNSTVSDVNNCFGEPVKKGKCNDVTGTVTDTYKIQYENRAVTVRATRRPLADIEISDKRGVFYYSFDIDCSDETDEKAVFEKLCNELIDDKGDNKRFRYEKEDYNEFSAYIDYGACSISYNIKYDIYDGENEVYFNADAVY